MVKIFGNKHLKLPIVWVEKISSWFLLENILSSMEMYMIDILLFIPLQNQHLLKFSTHANEIPY